MVLLCTVRIFLLLWLLRVRIALVVNAFVVVRIRQPKAGGDFFTASWSPLSLSLSAGDDADPEKQRMEMVRQLQKTFYKQMDGEDQEPGAKLEETTGRMMNLPLWRVGWVEVPGRSNVLNVHEPHYTNMFEKILSRKKPWYFGHLHLPGGTKAARTKEKRFELKNWKTEVQDINRFDESERERSAVVGCLMRISDYRRLQDGRLVLLVHALERFAVDEVVQSFPHGVAHVQMLPDVDGIVPSGVDENFGKHARAALVRHSFRYHEYECEPILLPLPQDTEYMAAQDVFGVEIAKCLPFCFYSSDGSMLDEIDPIESSNTSSMSDEEGAPAFAGGQPLLEERLQGELILRNPPPLPGVVRRETQDANALEVLLWLALDDFCRCYRFTLPEEILCLMPPHIDYLDMKSAKQPVSDNYPQRRRQQRLSYAVPALIENTNIGAPISSRQMLLNTPSTCARLAAVLERIEAMNDAATGRFQ